MYKLEAYTYKLYNHKENRYLKNIVLMHNQIFNLFVFVSQLTIHVTDENDNRPVFTQEIYTSTIPENVPQGYPVIRVNTTDADIGINAQHTFSITGIYTRTI